MPPKQTDPQFKLRLPAELKERIEAAAQANNRSMNAEMLARLERSFEVDRESLDWKRFEKFLQEEERHIAEEYLTGNTDDPRSLATGAPETELVGRFSKLINRRTELAMETIVRELEKRKLLAPNVRSLVPRKAPRLAKPPKPR